MQDIKFGYICADCAQKNGAKWPKNHIATLHKSICDICGEYKMLSNTSDWDWPADKKYLSEGREL